MAYQDDMLATPVDVLNYALTLEHLEFAFYRDGLQEFNQQAFVDGGYDPVVRTMLETIRDHEEEHVTTLTTVIESLNGTPVEEAEYDFGYSDFAGFLATAAALENTGVSAYQGAAPALMDEPELLTAALTIHGVEARHASYLNGLQPESPFPDAFNPALTPQEVLDIAGPFIQS